MAMVSEIGEMYGMQIGQHLQQLKAASQKCREAKGELTRTLITYRMMI